MSLMKSVVGSVICVLFIESDKMDKSFFFTTNWDRVDKLMKKLDEKKIPYLYITEWGTVPVNCPTKNNTVDESVIKLVIDTVDVKFCYVATPDYLDRSEDEVFVSLRKPNEPHRKLPNFFDVFELREL